MDQIYSPITSHHTVAQIEKVIDICDFYLLVVPALFIVCWIIYILYNLIFGQERKKIADLLFDSLPVGFIFAVMSFFYISKTFSC